MEALIIVLVVALGYLTFHMKKSDSQDEEFDRLKERLDTALDESPYKLEPIVATKRLDTALDESPYKLEPIVATKRKTRKRIVKKVVLKKPKVVKKKTVKKKVVKKRKVKK